MGKREITPLHRGGRVGDEGGEVVGEDRGEDDGPPAAFGRYRKKRGESPHSSSSSSLTFSLDGRRVSPLVLGSHDLGGARAPPRLELSLCFSVVRFYPFIVSFISGDP